MFFKPTLRLRNWWIRMGSRARLIRNSIVELTFCYQHPTVSLDIPKYSCFTRVLWCPTWYKTFWKLLNANPKQWRICHFYNHSLQSLCRKALPRLLPRWKHTEGRLALARDGQGWSGPAASVTHGKDTRGREQLSHREELPLWGLCPTWLVSDGPGQTL